MRNFIEPKLKEDENFFCKPKMAWIELNRAYEDYINKNGFENYVFLEITGSESIPDGKKQKNKLKKLWKNITEEIYDKTDCFGSMFFELSKI